LMREREGGKVFMLNKPLIKGFLERK
jgi:hypothetical protein